MPPPPRRPLRSKHHSLKCHLTGGNLGVSRECAEAADSPVFALGTVRIGNNSPGVGPWAENTARTRGRVEEGVTDPR